MTYNWILKLHDILKGKETFIISGYFYTQKKPLSDIVHYIELLDMVFQVETFNPILAKFKAINF